MPVLLVELLAAAADAHDCELALSAFASLKARAGAPLLVDEGTLVAVLAAAARRRNAALATEAWAALEQTTTARSLPPAPGSFLALAAARAACGDLESAFRALLALQGAHPALEVPEGALMPLITACSGGPSALDGAYFTLERLRDAGERVSPAALNVVIAACARAGDVSRAFETFDEIEPAFGAAPDVASFNALLTACVWHGRASAAPRLVAEMEAKGIAPDATTRALLVDGALAARDVQAAMRHVQAAVQAGVSLSRDTLRRLQAYLERNGDDQARATLADALTRFGIGHLRKMTTL